MSTDEQIEVGDYVDYTTHGSDSVASWREHGAGYVKAVKNGFFIIDAGDREVVATTINTRMRAKQYRLEV